MSPAATTMPYRPRHVLVTGVGGFVDSYDRRWKKANLVWLRAQELFCFLEADLRTSNLDLLVDGVDTVVHEAAFAGLARSWIDVEAYFDCNVLAMSRLVDACRRHDVRRFVELGYRPETPVEGLRAQVSWHLDAAVTAPVGHPCRGGRSRPVLAASSPDVPAIAGAIT